jgi:hypothetical protein
VAEPAERAGLGGAERPHRRDVGARRERAPFARHHQRARAGIARDLADAHLDRLERGRVERIERLRSVQGQQCDRTPALERDDIHGAPR